MGRSTSEFEIVGVLAPLVQPALGWISLGGLIVGAIDGIADALGDELGIVDALGDELGTADALGSGALAVGDRDGSGTTAVGSSLGATLALVIASGSDSVDEPGSAGDASSLEVVIEGTPESPLLVVESALASGGFAEEAAPLTEPPSIVTCDTEGPDVPELSAGA